MLTLTLQLNDNSTKNTNQKTSYIQIFTSKSDNKNARVTLQIKVIFGTISTTFNVTNIGKILAQNQNDILKKVGQELQSFQCQSTCVRDLDAWFGLRLHGYNFHNFIGRLKSGQSKSMTHYVGIAWSSSERTAKQETVQEKIECNSVALKRRIYFSLFSNHCHVHGFVDKKVPAKIYTSEDQFWIGSIHL